jgi:hypothetical protein
VLDSLGAQGLVLLVLAGPDDNVEKSFRNLANVRMAFPGNLGAYEAVYADWIVFTTPAIEAVKP